jgi:hypothetical protein
MRDYRFSSGQFRKAGSLALATQLPWSTTGVDIPLELGSGNVSTCSVFLRPDDPGVNALIELRATHSQDVCGLKHFKSQCWQRVACFLALRVPDAGHHGRGGEPSHARNRGNAGALTLAPLPAVQATVHLGDRAIQGAQSLELAEQLPAQQFAGLRQQ